MIHPTQVEGEQIFPRVSFREFTLCVRNSLEWKCLCKKRSNLPFFDVGNQIGENGLVPPAARIRPGLLFFILRQVLGGAGDCCRVPSQTGIDFRVVDPCGQDLQENFPRRERRNRNIPVFKFLVPPVPGCHHRFHCLLAFSDIKAIHSCPLSVVGQIRWLAAFTFRMPTQLGRWTLSNDLIMICALPFFKSGQ